MLMTTGNSFDGYHVEKYLGIVSKEAVCIGIESDKIDTTTLSFSLHEIAMNQTLRNTQQSNIRSKIDNKKKAILGALGNEASTIGANAILGIKIDISFSNDYLLISASGTAVLITKDIALGESVVDENTFDNSKIINVHATNMNGPFLPVHVIISSGAHSCNVILEMLRTENGMLTDIQANLVFRNIFDDVSQVENVCFSNARQGMGNQFYFEAYPIEMPAHIRKCIQSCDVIVKKYIMDNELHIPETLSVSELGVIDILSPEMAFFNKISTAESIDEIEKIWDQEDMGKLYPELTNKIKDKVFYEKMYGKRVEDVITFISKLKKELNI